MLGTEKTEIQTENARKLNDLRFLLGIDCVTCLVRWIVDEDRRENGIVPSVVLLRPEQV